MCYMDFYSFFKYVNYNSVVILSYFFISFFALILNVITGGSSNKLLFSTYRSNIFNPLTYLRLVLHVFGHADWEHFRNNFLKILLIGPMVEDKFGSYNLFIMIIITAVLTGILNSILSKKTMLLGASGIAFMLIILSSFVNIQAGKIPLTLIFIFLFYVFDEIRDGIFKKDNISHFGHIIGALCGCVYGFYILW